MTPDEAIALLLAGAACAGCGEPPGGPGEPCASCGRIPELTGPELREALTSSPLAVAEVEAAQALADGFAMLDNAIDRIHDANRVRTVAQLRLARDDAEEALIAHQAGRAALNAPRTAARKAEAQARAALEKATAEHQEIQRAEEIARRYKAGVRAESEAMVLLQQATTALSRYQAEHAEAAARLRAAEAAIEQFTARTAQLQATRDAAQAALSNPGRIGYGAQAITAGLLRLLMGGQLSEPEQLIAGELARHVCSATGVTQADRSRGAGPPCRRAGSRGQVQAALAAPGRRRHRPAGRPEPGPPGHADAGRAVGRCRRVVASPAAGPVMTDAAGQSLARTAHHEAGHAAARWATPGLEACCCRQ